MNIVQILDDFEIDEEYWQLVQGGSLNPLAVTANSNLIDIHLNDLVEDAEKPIGTL